MVYIIMVYVFITYSRAHFMSTLSFPSEICQSEPEGDAALPGHEAPALHRPGPDSHAQLESTTLPAHLSHRGRLDLLRKVTLSF